ncbi:hypothetical protein [Paenibacillus agilis]|uniref:Prenylated flavin chaperone LpdD-like domain-containing protein n=1 Tax=Paenibacillus agilis TaxID=3020863 RepID=A0A559IZW2_9BACL|nr:hypothetical protein [Paenibacillus agilis]TVX93147.1 hypothetical protein FPZ44_08795 [Paenibacillus agilis]
MNDKDRVNQSWEDTILCEVIPLGRDYIIRLSGGAHMHHHHIGAVSTAYYAEPMFVSDLEAHNRSVTNTFLAQDEISISIASDDNDTVGCQGVKGANLTHLYPHICTMTHVVPGHKEAILSEPMAMEAANRLRTTVTVIAGIHYEQLQIHEIDQVVDAAWCIFRKALTQAL